CALGAWGLDWLAQQSRVMAGVLVVLLGTWACNSYASFWIHADSAVTCNWAGTEWLRQHRLAKAEGEFRKALEVEPRSAAARINLSNVFVQSGRPTQARHLIESALRDDPTNLDALFGLALFLRSDGRTEEAVDLLRKASDQAPDSASVYSVLAMFL